MKRCILYVLLFIIAIAGSRSLLAQTPVVKWNKTIGGTNYDQLNCLQQTSDGGFIAGGISDSDRSADKSQLSNGASDYWIVRLDSNGTKLWDKTLGGPNGDYLKTLQQTSDGGFILGGWSQSGIGGDKTQALHGWDDYWVIRIDSSGNKIWEKSFGGINQDLLYAVHQTPDGNFVLVGMSDSPQSNDKTANNYGQSGRDFWILKIDQNGNKLWDKTIGSDQDDSLPVFLQCADGSFLLGGSSQTGAGGNKSQAGFGKEDYWILKLDASGNVLWNKTFGGSGTDNLGGLEQTADGGYLIGGSSDSGISGDKSQNSRGAFDFWILKLDANGTKLWDKTIGGNASDRLTGLKQSKEQNYFLVGSSLSGFSGDKASGSSGGSDYWVVKLDSSGNKIWDKTYGSNDMDELNAFQLLPKEGLIVGGASNSNATGVKSQPSKGNYDFWVLKLLSPCTYLDVAFQPACLLGKANLNVSISVAQTVSNTNKWTLTYNINGTRQTIISGTTTVKIADRPAEGTVYTLESVTIGGCTKQLSKSFTFQPLPAALVVSIEKRCSPGIVTLTATGAPKGSKYLWYDQPTGGNPLKQDTIGIFKTKTIVDPVLFYVSAANKDGCEGPRTQVLAEISYCPEVFIPNVLTQNRDGLNEFFRPKYLPEGKWHLQIYNRWGTRVFESEDYQNNWPDFYLPAATFYYLLKNPETGQQFKGWIELLN